MSCTAQVFYALLIPRAVPPFGDRPPKQPDARTHTGLFPDPVPGYSWQQAIRSLRLKVSALRLTKPWIRSPFFAHTQTKTHDWTYGRLYYQQRRVSSHLKHDIYIGCWWQVGVRWEQSLMCACKIGTALLNTRVKLTMVSYEPRKGIEKWRIEVSLLMRSRPSYQLSARTVLSIVKKNVRILLDLYFFWLSTTSLMLCPRCSITVPQTWIPERLTF